MTDITDNQSMVDDDVARALDSLADIDPAQPSAMPGDPAVAAPTTFNPSVGDPAAASDDPSVVTPQANGSMPSPISDVTGPSGTAVPADDSTSSAVPEDTDMPAVLTDSGEEPVIGADISPAGVADLELNGVTSEPVVAPGVDGVAEVDPGIDVGLPDIAVDGDSINQPADTNDQNTGDMTTNTPQAHHTGAPSGEIERIRAEAAKELEPLIESIDDSYERFSAAISMVDIGTVDDDKRAKLLNEALTAAKSIEDQKLRAEALAEILHHTH